MKPAVDDADAYRLEIFRGDPILRWLHERDVPSAYLLLTPVVFLAVAIACAAADHSLTQPHLGSHICHDLAGILPARPSWSCLRTHGPSDATISLLRDFPSLISIIVVGLAPYFIYRHWRGLTDLFPSMVRDRLTLFATDDDHRRFLDEINAANRYFDRIARLGGLFGLIAALFGLPLLQAERSGVYPSFMMSEGIGASVATNYSQWWASYDHGFGWTAYYLITLAAGYFTILMNAYGFRPVVLLYRTRKLVVFEASEDLATHYFGWRRAREVLAATYVSTVFFGVVLFCLAAALNRHVLGGILPFFVVWAVVLPFYVCIPVYVTVTSIRRYRTTAGSKIRSRLAVLRDDDSSGAISERNELSDRLERVDSIPALPFRIKDFVVGVLTAFVGIATIYAALALWYRIY